MVVGGVGIKSHTPHWQSLIPAVDEQLCRNASYPNNHGCPRVQAASLAALRPRKPRRRGCRRPDAAFCSSARQSLRGERVRFGGAEATALAAKPVMLKEGSSLVAKCGKDGLVESSQERARGEYGRAQLRNHPHLRCTAQLLQSAIWRMKSWRCCTLVGSV
ncbi:uncharacterized protein BKA78DRAFT_100722 [Phyllosticta capitalensis]|uniref:uncharacterized protein n=1 Tax=Phyllosticta capitalensis TaxID=121624 RepID=UPI00312E3DB2